MKQPDSNRKMIEKLKQKDRIKSKKVEESFKNVDRKNLVPEKYQDQAYADRPLPLNGETISAPHMVAEVTELLELSGNEKILEIGSGSGYQAAILGEIVENVVGVEINEKLAEVSQEKTPLNVKIIHGNGLKAVEEKFDRVLYSCATETLEEALKHVKENGKIVGPVKENGKQVLKKWDSGELSSHGRVRYVEKQG